MAISTPQAPEANIFDTSSLQSLRHGLQDPGESDLRQVAEEFETVFVGIMLKSMRAATPGDELFGGNAMEQYEQLHDQQLATSIGRQGGFGIADMVERQLREQAGFETDAGAIRDRGLEDYDRRLPPMRMNVAEPESEVAPKAGAAEPVAPGGKGAGWDNPEEFVRDVWPAAEKAADRLGADPRVLVAQAALETGWGQHVIRDGDGEPSHNLFGIKAHNGWEGDTVRVPTLEFRDGVPQREMASFRAYDSLEESFQDYVRFLEDNPRYSEALEQSGDPAAWAEALQDAGYATDPAYAEKIRSILGGDVLEAALDPLKPAPDRPTTEA
ncbi:flagellar assembly peptidoglycan hydrolase FlgJ [Aquisalimonas sp. 2447]|uniref:flagellar assembly peptidoglycan hydrolase FlgJ n=1 Tax=Aquisalimonas sp. 2447 TaxID=2740807 RepID=UPI0014325F29|nr:flagellar assembly peptidoglycan hydrolase FlgJ [Aquisalimonas sp. 2447]QIT56168.1 flagellar assembly peptidoglycan hydrolase FlgJ [Aquisalimonas sp. 2447]